LLLGDWQGIRAVTKLRKPMSYRIPALDHALRRHRTLREAEMIHSAKRSGIRTPRLFFVDPVAATLVMEYIEGVRLKDLVDRSSGAANADIFEMLGRDVARMHASGIMHGDLTTANVIKSDGELVFLDFGLAAHTHRVEDHAVDLRLIKETIVGAHNAVAPLALDSLREGYSSQLGEERSRHVLNQLRSIERRGRYARVV
jgi:TP53 regulating kinase and related kinases